MIIPNLYVKSIQHMIFQKALKHKILGGNQYSKLEEVFNIELINCWHRQ